MQTIAALVRQPILLGLMLSVAIHVAVLQGRSRHVPPTPHLESGRTVMNLVLLPSLASPASQPEPSAETTPAQQSVPSPQESLPEPENEPVAKTAAPESIAQDASMENDKGVTAEAAATNPFLPAYPRISQRRGEEGSVTLSVQVLADGTVGAVGILQSSGYRRLDAAAVKSARQTRFTPALRRGHAIESTIQLPYTFRLTHD